MKTGDVLLFIGGEDLIDDCIKAEGHSVYTHAALAVNSTSFVEAWWDGARLSTLEGRNNIVVFSPIIPLTEDQQYELIGYCRGKIGEQYNFLQLAGFLYEKLFGTTHNPFGSPHETICSQLVIQGYRDLLGIDLLPGIEDYSVTPSDLALSKLLRQEASTCQ
jgi:uncharacterized protein YycO